MFENFEKVFFLVDFIGTSPNLRILNNNNYKSIISSIISIIIIIISIFFTIFSFIDYLNQNPIISYYKSIDDNTDQIFRISDSFLMFKLNDFSDCLEEDYIDKSMTYYINDKFKNEFELEKCELGKNIDLKYKNIIEDFEKDSNKNISDYLCPDYRGEKISIYNTHYNFSYLSLFISKKFKNNCSPNKEFFYTIEIVSENDDINHNNKNNPCVQSYQNKIIYGHDYIELFELEYNFNYIKYDSDNGFFFQKYTSQDLISFSDMFYNTFNSFISRNFLVDVQFNMNKISYDYYRRAYSKIQSLLADIANIINLLILFGKILSSFLLDKQMSRDIFQTIITNEKIQDSNLSLTLDKIKFNKNPEIKIGSSSRRDARTNFELNSLFDNINSDNKVKQNNINKSTKIKILNNLKFFDFFKSHFCFKNIKYKLIDSCHDLFKEEICIDNILKRLYNLENCILVDNDSSISINKKKNKYELIDEYLSIILNDKIYGNKINDKTNEIKNKI